MIVHHTKETDLIDQWDLDKISSCVDEIWYHYEIGDYCGSGEMIYRSGKQYGLWDMGHCSCYGPTDNFTIDFSGKSVLDCFRDASRHLLDDYASVVQEYDLIAPRTWKRIYNAAR